MLIATINKAMPSLTELLQNRQHSYIIIIIIIDKLNSTHTGVTGQLP